LLKIIESWTSERSGQECERALMRAGVPCARYRTVAEAMADPQLQARGTLTELRVGDGRFKVANPASKLSRSRTVARPLVAELGQHTDEVVQEVLGVEADALAELRARGAFGRG
jgi:crotonobetainyl-CoA:carnitine CoA-transferase CaiB-like acyl-CoA transferase